MENINYEKIVYRFQKLLYLNKYIFLLLVFLNAYLIIFIYLRGKVTHRERQTQIFYMLVHSPDACNRWGWTKPKIRAPSRSPTWMARTQSLETPSTTSQAHQQEIRQEVEYLGLEPHSNMRCKHPKHQFNPPTHNANSYILF